MARQTIKNDEPLKLTCICCGAKNQANFYVTQDKMHKTFGKIPYCKDCCEKILQNNLETSNGDLERAVWLTCAKFRILEFSKILNYRGSGSKNKGSKIARRILQKLRFG